MSATTGGNANDFGWFTTWVHQHLTLSLTFARGLSPEQLLVGLGLETRALGQETFVETEDQAPWDSPPKIRVGDCAGWAYAVEGSSQRGARELGRLSLASGEAFALVYTPTISTFEYAIGGEFVSGFDLCKRHLSRCCWRTGAEGLIVTAPPGRGRRKRSIGSPTWEPQRATRRCGRS